MPLTRLAVDALGVVTVSLVTLVSLFGLFCIIYILYFRSRIQSSRFVQLRYFNGPWIVRIVLVVVGIWWGIGEIIRLSFLRQGGVVWNSLGQKWQEDVCRFYIISNLGFAEPCLFVTMSFLLRASLQWRGPGILDKRWNYKTAGYILLSCLPVFILDLIFVLAGPKFLEDRSKLLKLPHFFTSTNRLLSLGGKRNIVICTNPLLSTILHGLFTIVLTTCLLLLGRRVVSSVINKGLRRRVYILIFLVSCFLPLRVVLLGFSVMAKARILLEALAFSGFLVLLCCVVVAVYMLVYLPISDSLALRRGVRGSSFEFEDGGGGSRGVPLAAMRSVPTVSADYNEDSVGLIESVSRNNNDDDAGAPATGSMGRNSDASTKRGSISFRTMIREEACGTGTGTGAVEEEMTTLPAGSNTILNLSPPRTPSLVGGRSWD